jgi:hypothetical protein
VSARLGRSEITGNMQQILVINNVGLWLSLNRHLAGQGSVRLSEAPSLEMGIRLAKVELPDLVVCSTDNLGHSPEELSRLLAEAGLETMPVVCVDHRATRSHPMDAGDTGLSVCSSSGFLEAVDRAMPVPESPGTSTCVDLLAHFEFLSDQPDETRRGFVNVLEVDAGSLLIESNQSLEIGDLLLLSLFLPRRGDDAASEARVQVSMRCEVRHCRHEGKLLYEMKILEVPKGSEADWKGFTSANDASQARRS